MSLPCGMSCLDYLFKIIHSRLLYHKKKIINTQMCERNVTTEFK